MQHDEMIWQVINHQFCSYKTKIGVALSEKRDFCKHPHSVTGVCNRSSCPLANSRYATVRETEGRVHLYVKTVERAHSPKNLWEKIYLSRNYSRAMAQLDEHLAHFPKFLVHRNKQRLTKIHQYLIRMRKIKLKELSGRKATMTRVHRKVEQREERREKKALVAAKIENSIEKELIERLAKGTYGDIYNFPEAPYQKALNQMGEQEEEEEEEEEYNSEEELVSEDEDQGAVEYVEDLEEEDEEDMEEDMEDMHVSSNAWDDDSEESESSEDEEDSVDGDEEESNSESESGSDDSGGSTEGSEDDEESRRKKKLKPPKKKQPKKPPAKKGTRIEIEYEDEDTNEAIMEDNSNSAAGMAW